MNKLILFLFLFTLSFPETSISQIPLMSIKGEPGFKSNDYAISIFDPVSNTYHLNLQNGDNIYRRLYDTSFNLLNEYSFETKRIGFSNNSFEKPRFISPLNTAQGYFEIYSFEDDILIYEVNFLKKKDSLIKSFNFNEKKTGEKLISLMPDRNDLKMLVYSEDLKYFQVYKWTPGDSIKKFLFETTGSGLTKEEEKKYTKSCQVKYKKIGQLTSARINSLQTFPISPNVYFDENRILIVADMPYSVGIHLIEINIEKNIFRTKNFFLNSLKINASNNDYLKRRFVSTILDTVLVIQNSSYYQFEYLFYNINTGALIKKHSVPVEDSIYKFVNSSFKQKGTILSKNQEKELKREKAFMRKIGGSFSTITVPYTDKDTVVFTLSSLQYTNGIVKTLLSEGTSIPLSDTWGYQADLYTGSLQTIPYLTSNIYLLFYFHSKFDMRSFEPVATGTVTTCLDRILNTFETKELSSNSSFTIQKSNESLIGVFNKETTAFDIYKFRNYQ